LALAEGAAAAAATSFTHAAAGWQALGHPYDQARALCGLAQALARTDDRDGSHPAAEQAQDLMNVLAGQLEDPALKSSFLNSPLVQEIRTLSSLKTSEV
jgi:hypothetical protein